MEIAVITIGKTATPYLRQGIDEYLRRLSHYYQVRFVELADIRKSKGTTPSEQKQREGKLILSAIRPSDAVVLLDEKGTERTSEQFAVWMEKKLGSGRKRLVMVIGGPYGFSADVYTRADELASLSRMTFNHEMARLFLAEQLYRAATIIRGEPYHHT